MTKYIELRREEGVNERMQTLRLSAAATRHALAAALDEADPLQSLARMKFEPIGHDPLEVTRRLNLIEQLNQTFTYLATFKAASVLFQKHPSVNVLRLSLGNISGWDIESAEDGGIVAEVFAAVSPKNNQKLRADIKKLLCAHHKYRYVFYMCPRMTFGEVQNSLARERVTVWSLGDIL